MRRDVLAMIALVGAMGWDGQDYLTWAHDFPHAVRARVTAYQSQRIVPSTIIVGPRGARRDLARAHITARPGGWMPTLGCVPSPRAVRSLEPIASAIAGARSRRVMP